MSDFPISFPEVNVTIHPYSLESCGVALTALGVSLNASISATYPTANMALLVPFVLVKPVLIATVFWWNGTAVSGNVDLGVYTNEGGASAVCRKIFSTGSTAQSDVSVLQTVDIADVTLGEGSYYMAIAVDNTTARFFRVGFAIGYFPQAVGFRAVASSFPLPATITSFTEPAPLSFPIFGLHTRTVV